MKASRDEINAFRRQGYRPNASTPRQPDPEWLTVDVVAALLGITSDALQTNYNGTYSWLPLPQVAHDAGRPHLVWHRDDTVKALAQGRPKFPFGWHKVPGVEQAEVWIGQTNARPSKVKLFNMPADPAHASEIGDAVELALWMHFGCRRFIDAVLVDGVHALCDHMADPQSSWRWR